MEHDSKTVTTHYLTLDEEDVASMSTLIDLAEQQIKMLPPGSASGVLVFIDDLKSSLGLRSYLDQTGGLPRA